MTTSTDTSTTTTTTYTIISLTCCETYINVSLFITAADIGILKMILQDLPFIPI